MTEQEQIEALKLQVETWKALATGLYQDAVAFLNKVEAQVAKGLPSHATFPDASEEHPQSCKTCSTSPPSPENTPPAVQE